jgi:hypothetical protein
MPFGKPRGGETGGGLAPVGGIPLQRADEHFPIEHVLTTNTALVHRQEAPEPRDVIAMVGQPPTCEGLTLRVN